MSRSKLEIVSSSSDGMPAAEGRRFQSGLLVMAGITLGVSVAMSWMMHTQLTGFLSTLDADSLSQAISVYDRTIEQQRGLLASQVALLADDTRVRAPVMTPSFDEATVRDVLEDLKKVSGANMLAVLDVNGRVRAVAGAQSLRDLDLGSSPVVKTALKGVATDVWSFPDRVLVVAVGAVKSADRVAALLVVGFDVNEPFLAGIEKALGVASAVLVGDRVAASSTRDPAMLKAFPSVSGAEDRVEQVVVGEQEFAARVSRTSTAAAAGKVVWLVPHHHETGRVIGLRVMNWGPAVLVALMIVLVFSIARRGATPAR